MIVNFSDAPEVMYWNGIGSGSEGIWVDKLSRKLFPMIYTVFNLLYWIICCTSGHIPYPSNVIRHPIELIEGWRSFFIMRRPLVALDCICESYLKQFSCALLISDLNIVYLWPMYILTILIPSYCSRKKLNTVCIFDVCYSYSNILWTKMVLG